MTGTRIAKSLDMVLIFITAVLNLNSIVMQQFNQLR
jgi:hypothetical protein